MNKDIIEQWEANKGKLEEYFKTTKQENYDDYKDIFEKIVELILTNEKYDTKRITEIDDGDYQGMKIFIIPEDTYQPYIDNYLFTYVDYGSCSGCDTLQSIHEYENDLPTKEQVEEYMTLALHIIQRMKRWGDFED